MSIKPYFQNDLLTLYCGDCLEILPQLKTKFDLCLTDPPYGVNFKSKKFAKIQNDNDTFSYLQWCKLIFELLNDNTAVFAYTGWKTYPQHFIDLQTAGFNVKEPLITQRDAGNCIDIYGSFQTNTDWILFGTKGKFSFYQTQLVRNSSFGGYRDIFATPTPEWKFRFPSCWFGEQYPKSTLCHKTKTSKNYPHPTIKNPELLKWIIQLSSETDGVIIDPFCGSGSTLVAASELGQRCVGIEIEEKYCEMIVRRLNVDKD